MAEKKKKVTFSFNAPDAEAVYLVGSFNGWAVGSDEMNSKRDGVWKKTKYLAPSIYEYKFVVDGVWREDPECPEQVAGPYGTLNSVLHI